MSNRIIEDTYLKPEHKNWAWIKARLASMAESIDESHGDILAEELAEELAEIAECINDLRQGTQTHT